MVTVATATEDAATNIVYADPVTVYGQLNAKDLSAAYESFGIESKQPHKFIFELDCVSLFTIGSRVVYDNRSFAVTSPVRISKHGLVTDHAAVMLEELDI